MAYFEIKDKRYRKKIMIQLKKIKGDLNFDKVKSCLFLIAD